ncbi:hypothetical protein H0H92_007937 [Tricholoma furcatifolium]|nr:hypothetical protein H0H92_007937 [Tricholoma furcatifolium]
MFDTLTLGACTSILGLGILIYVHSSHNYGHKLKLPPGPTGLPLLGNVLQVPNTHLATHFRKLIDEYGGLVSLNLAGFSVILVGDFNLGRELLDKHSAKHSSRPAMKYFNHYVNPTSDYWVVAPFGDVSHTLGRKFTVGIMASVRAGKTEALQAFEALLNVQLLLGDGEKDWFQHIERGFGEHDTLSWIRSALPHRDRTDTSRVPRRYSVLRMALTSIYLVPYATEPQRRPGIRDSNHQHHQRSGFSIPQLDPGPHIMAPQGTIGLQTSKGYLAYSTPNGSRRPRNNSTKLLVQIVYKDRPLLPYIEAIDCGLMGCSRGFKVETRRAIEHDESTYKDHDRFMPERFLDSESNLKTEYNTSAFGFGRRICPGVPFAERSLFINIALMLWAFNIKPSSSERDPKTGLQVPFQYDDSDASFNGDQFPDERRDYDLEFG